MTTEKEAQFSGHSFNDRNPNWHKDGVRASVAEGFTGSWTRWNAGYVADIVV